jgi:hypothetical protein
MNNNSINRNRLFAVAAAAFVLSACASNANDAITVPPAVPAQLKSGFMRVTVQMAGKLDYTKYQYGVTFNSTGTSLTPEYGSKNVDWKAYSATLAASEAGGSPVEQVIQYVSNPNDPNQPPAQVVVPYTPSQLQFVQDAGNDSFSVTFERSLAIVGSGQPATTWRFNAYSRSAKQVVDTMGSCASCFKSPALPVATSFLKTIAAQGKSSAPPGARIVNIEFQNAP